MRKIYFLGITLFYIFQLSGQTKKIIKPFQFNYFIEEKGQFNEYLNYIDIDIQDKIICGIENNAFNAYFTENGVYFILPERIKLKTEKYEDEEENDEFESEEEKEYHYKTSTSVYHTIAFKWDNPDNLTRSFSMEGLLSSYSNFQALNEENSNKFNFSKNFKKLTIKNIFKDVDITFYLDENNGIKYTLTDHNPSLEKEYHFKWEGVENLSLEAEKLIIQSGIKKDFNSNDRWYFTDAKPNAFLTESKKEIQITEETDKNNLIFKLQESTFNKNEDLIIDPYIVNPNFPNLNRAYDIQEDGAGNILVYGNYSGGSIKYHIQKYDALGNLLWTYQTYSVFLGDIAADAAGNVYIIGGYCTGYRQKLDPSGVQIWAQTGLCEEWRLSFDLSKSILTIGGNFLTSNIGNLDTQTGNLANTILYNEETRAITTDCDGTVYSLTLPGNTGTKLRKISNYTLANTVPAGFNVLYSGTGYAYNPDYSTSVFQGINGIHVYGNYVYIYNGQEVRVFYKNTLNFITSTNPPGGSFMLCSGITNDYCNNIYIGTTNGIVVYDSLLNQVSTINTPGAVYDIILSQTGDIIASGDGFWGVFSTNCAIPQPFVVTYSIDSCSSGSLSVNATGGIPPYTYLWSNGATTPTINNLTADTFSVYVHDKFCNEYRDTFLIHPTPVAKFVTNNVCEYSAATFTDSSTISTPDFIAGYYWDFGDGNTDNTASPTHSYSGPGQYTVKHIIASNNACIDSITKTIYIHPAPSASFTTANVCSYQTANFTDQSSIAFGNITQWSWDFGDGNSDNQQNTAHNYGVGNAGTYPVKLVVTSDSNCVDSITKNIIINPKPVANFSYLNDCVDIPAQFTDISSVSSGNIAGWLWNFGDGNSNNNQNPTHLYQQDGDHIVQLIVTSDSLCLDTIQDTIVRYPVPVPYLSSQEVCVYDSAHFNDLSTINTTINFPGSHAPDTVTAWSWNFGDGTPNSTLQNPAHLFNSFGQYAIQLTAYSNHGCSDDTTLFLYIHDKPNADFTADTPCVNTPPTHFSDLSYVNNSNNYNDVINFWSWDFNNGQGNASVQNPTFNFGSEGAFSVQLIVTSDFGCLDTTLKNIIVFEKPTADFTVDTAAFCQPYCVNFSDLSSSNTANIVAWNWDLDNGQSDISSAPTTCYENLSNSQLQFYSPSLIVQNSYGCYDTITKNNFITVWPLPLADFDAQPQSTDIFEPLVEFPNYSVGASSWVWHFGDGSNDSSNFSPQHLYADSGTYNVFLEVWSQYGCYDSIFKSVRINPDFAIFIPNAFTPDNVGGNETFFFKGYGIMQEDFEFYIYDRWGNLIYYTTEFKPWDGTYKGQPVKQDVYVYKFVVKDFNYIIHNYVGSVTLLR